MESKIYFDENRSIDLQAHKKAEPSHRHSYPIPIMMTRLFVLDSLYGTVSSKAILFDYPEIYGSWISHSDYDSAYFPDCIAAVIWISIADKGTFSFPSLFWISTIHSRLSSSLIRSKSLGLTFFWLLMLRMLILCIWTPFKKFISYTDQPPLK